MKKISYEIQTNNHQLTLFQTGAEIPLLSSFWFMEFGKTCAEMLNADQKTLYSITKKFQFWKWRMVYHISKNVNERAILISQNTRNTIFKIELLSGNYEVKVHYKKKKSIFKDGVKIAEFNESETNKTQTITLLVVHEKDVEISFLLYVCLLIGVNDFSSKTVLTSQKKLEKNTKPWF